MPAPRILRTAIRRVVRLGAAALLGLAGCAAPPASPALPEAGSAAPDLYQAGARTYDGPAACEGCAGLRVTLTVFADGTFRLRQADAGGRAPATHALGRWSVSSDAPDVIVLRSGAAERSFRRVRPDGLAELGAAGAVFTPLARAARVDPLAGPWSLAGMYRRQDDGPVFVECLTGRRHAIVAAVPDGGAPPAGGAPAAAQQALEAAHREISATPGDAVLAFVQGYFVPAGALPGVPSGEALVVTAFERAMRHARCEDVPRIAR